MNTAAGGAGAAPWLPASPGRGRVNPGVQVGVNPDSHPQADAAGGGAGGTLTA